MGDLSVPINDVKLGAKCYDDPSQRYIAVKKYGFNQVNWQKVGKEIYYHKIYDV